MRDIELKGETVECVIESALEKVTEKVKKMKLHTLVCLFGLAFALIAEAMPSGDVPMRTSSASVGKEQCQCWAVTRSGNRCKRRARPGERYCRQHATSVAPGFHFRAPVDRQTGNLIKYVHLRKLLNGKSQ